MSGSRAVSQPMASTPSRRHWRAKDSTRKGVGWALPRRMVWASRSMVTGWSGWAATSSHTAWLTTMGSSPFFRALEVKMSAMEVETTARKP